MITSLRRLTMAPVHRWFQFSDQMPLKVKVWSDRTHDCFNERRLVDNGSECIELDEFKPFFGFPKRRGTRFLCQRLVDVGCIVAKALADRAFRCADAENRSVAITPSINNAAEQRCTFARNVNDDSIATTVQRHDGDSFELRPINNHTHVLNDSNSRASRTSGVVSNFTPLKGTGAGSTLQETPNITFSQEAAE